MAFCQPVTSLCLKLDGGQLYYSRESLVSNCDLIGSFLDDHPNMEEIELINLPIADVKLLLTFLQTLDTPSDRDEMAGILRAAEYLCLVPKYLELLRKEIINNIGWVDPNVTIRDLIIGLPTDSPCGLPGRKGSPGSCNRGLYNHKAEKIRDAIHRYETGKITLTGLNRLMVEYNLYPDNNITPGYNRKERRKHPR